MRKQRWAVLPVVISLLTGCICLPAQSAEQEVRVAGPMPAFALRDLNGGEVKRSQFEGKALIVVFWVSTDRNCREQMPVLVELQRKLGGPDFTVLGLALDPSGPEAVKAYVQKHGVNFPVLLADYQVVQGFGGLKVVPTSFLIDKNHNIILKYEGQTESKVFDAGLKAIFKK